MIFDYLFLISACVVLLSILYLFFKRHGVSISRKVIQFSNITSNVTNSKANNCLVIHVSSGSINVALASLAKNKPLDFIYSMSVPFIGERPTDSKLLPEMIGILDSSIKEVIKKGFLKNNVKDRRISHAVISLSSPWFILKTKKINLTKESPFTITKTFINSILSDEESRFKEELSGKASDTSHDYIVIEKSIVHTKINGYSVVDIMNKRTRSLEAYVYVSAISKLVDDAVMGVISKNTHLGREDVMIHSFPLVLFSSIRDFSSSDANFLIINISSEVTDIVLVRDQIIESTTSFSFGKNTIIRELSKQFKVSLEIAESQLSMYLSEKTDASVSNSMQNILVELEKEWSTHLTSALLVVSPNSNYPKKTFLFVKKNISPIFLKLLESGSEGSIPTFRKNIQIIEIDESIFKDEYEAVAKIQVDIALIALAVFHNKLFQIQ
ncbi:MAG: hypothetical protein A2566_00760 [Candidatus Zambryskibacteria bacterium RIFOXYD1_FULL_40_13]|nr:MAG: hypothetical protein UT25_C0001G0137 [Parcubacteria group bacterium GW2011_GWC1_39_12]KKR19661.1 MAG: hypothetical protein UT49_C0001G0137 [Parcubacteria group bacterium GW2011_GWF1_39_37]KKR35817.1 MAG: hypothetical protein UT68_C0001G0140 [Parcubacteria group bacterium GW2011_GWC2_40_10]KKR52629.1 MAG: hypothetical protein UT89_C0001G0137 [Parcubacteria group bacterium GW2011_GWE1_40_20]KKR64770.1 MAG: hypothetical protein UU06_C0042G0002 [Parcubacteria group bacterium GW2011_GWB1_40_